MKHAGGNANMTRSKQNWGFRFRSSLSALTLVKTRRVERRVIGHVGLGLRNALGLAEAGIAIMDNQITTGEGRERERDKRSVDRS